MVLGPLAARIRIVPSAFAAEQLDTDSEVLINLAYVKTVAPHRAARENRRLVDLAHDLASATSGPRALHARTNPVFVVPLRARAAAFPRRRRPAGRARA